MNSKTKEALKELMEEIMSLGNTLYLTIGERNARALYEAAVKVRDSLATEDNPS